MFGALVLLCIACASVPPLPTAEDDFPVPPVPDYATAAAWAALPARDDAADRTPNDTLLDRQATAPADVFFVHPTIYRDTRRGNRYWNADVADERLNAAVDESTILNQASIFNAAGKVYAPRYRQAHLRVFYDEGAPVKQQALDTAYTDVLAAFDHFVATYNQGRPIILAAHSQGTLHAERLVQDRFVGTPLADRLVAAYLVGMPIRRDAFDGIPVCETPTQTGCFVSWRTYRDDYVPTPARNDPAIAVVNPLTWTTDEIPAPATLNRGAVLYKYAGGLHPELVGAQVRGAFLYTNKPRFFGSFLFRTKNYHVADYNFFWLNVREDAVRRTDESMSQ